MIYPLVDVLLKLIGYNIKWGSHEDRIRRAWDRLEATKIAAEFPHCPQSQPPLPNLHSRPQKTLPPANSSTPLPPPFFRHPSPTPQQPLIPPRTPPTLLLTIKPLYDLPLNILPYYSHPPVGRNHIEVTFLALFLMMRHSSEILPPGREMNWYFSSLFLIVMRP
jgi:hypothetical protein